MEKTSKTFAASVGQLLSNGTDWSACWFEALHPKHSPFQDMSIAFKAWPLAHGHDSELGLVAKYAIAAKCVLCFWSKGTMHQLTLPHGDCPC